MAAKGPSNVSLTAVFDDVAFAALLFFISHTLQTPGHVKAGLSGVSLGPGWNGTAGGDHHPAQYHCHDSGQGIEADPAGLATRGRIHQVLGDLEGKILGLGKRGSGWKGFFDKPLRA